MERVTPYIESGVIDGIRLSTRPDYISDGILENLKRYGVTTIELGVQSMSDTVLKASNRGHTADDVRDAVRKIRQYDFSLGLQMMTGLVGDSGELSLYTAAEIIKLKPDFVRIYPTLTIKDTHLATLYERGEYVPQTLDGAVELAKRLVLMFEKAEIGVIRVGLQPTEEINSDASVVAGPFHSSFRELVENSIYLDIFEDIVADKSGQVTIYVNPREISKAVGNKRCNIDKIKEKYNIDIVIKGDENLKKREVRYICC